MKKLFSFLKRPPLAFAFVVLLSTIVSIATMSFLFLTETQTPYAEYVAYAFSALSLVGGCYSVYILKIYRRPFREKMTVLSERWKWLDKVYGDYDFRSLLTTVPSFLASVGFSAYNAYFGIKNASVWFISLAAYYGLLVITRSTILVRARKGKIDPRTSARIYRNCGFFLASITLALSVAIAQMISQNASFEKVGLLIYVSAIYSFYKITMAIVHFVRAKKGDDLITQTIRNVNLCDAAVSLLALQTAMFHSFGGTDTLMEQYMNGAFGLVVCLLSFVVGVVMIVRGEKKIKAFQEEGNGE